VAPTLKAAKEGSNPKSFSNTALIPLQKPKFSPKRKYDSRITYNCSQFYKPNRMMIIQSKSLFAVESALDYWILSSHDFDGSLYPISFHLVVV
jgi:hypothetical protein